ncbi:MAG: A24 family peptidase, partial [Armatimonadota bacterium]
GMNIIDAIITVVLAAALAVSLYTDMTRGKILNKVTLPCIPLGLVLWGVATGWQGVLFSLAGIACGSIALLIAGGPKWIAPGDAKLMVAIGALQGATFVGYTALFGAIAGGVMAVGVMLRRHLLRSWARQTAVAVSSHLPVQSCWASRAGYIPYSIAIAIGALTAGLYSLFV